MPKRTADAEFPVEREVKNGLALSLKCFWPVLAVRVVVRIRGGAREMWLEFDQPVGGRHWFHHRDAVEPDHRTVIFFEFRIIAQPLLKSRSVFLAP